MNVLTDLPIEIFYVVTDYLSDPELLLLQLVSSEVKAKVPPYRLQRLYAKKTYFVCETSLIKLFCLSQTEHLAQHVTHLAFDLALPYLTLNAGSSGSYPNPFGIVGIDLDEPTKQAYIPRLKDLIARSFGVTGVDHSISAQPDPYDNGAGHELNMLMAQYSSEVARRATKVDIWNPVGTELFNLISDSIKAFPNLKILEITSSAPTGQESSEKVAETVEFRVALSKWVEHNPALHGLFFLDATEDDEGFASWMAKFTSPWTPLALNKVFPYILFAAVRAGRQISEVRLSPELSRQGASTGGVDLTKLDSGNLSDTLAWNDWYKYIFENLKRIDLHIGDDEVARYPNNGRCDATFKSIVANVEEVNITQVVDFTMKGYRAYWYQAGFLAPGGAGPSNTARQSGVDGFPFSVDTPMTRLKKVTIGDARIKLEGLTAFLTAHHKTIRELKVIESSFIPIPLPRTAWVGFLRTMKEKMDFEVFDFEIPIVSGSSNNEVSDRVAMGIYAKGSWKDPESAPFRHRKVVILSGLVRSEGEMSRANGWEGFLQEVAGFRG